MIAKHAPLHDSVRSAFIEQVDAPRELSFEEMDSVSGGNDIKRRLGVIKLRAKGQGCMDDIIFACFGSIIG